MISFVSGGKKGSWACIIILTCKFSHKNGFYENAAKTVFDGSQQTLPKLLQVAGYHTGIVGKWHLRSTPTGFDSYSIHYDQGEYYNPDFMENDEKRVHYEGYATDLTADNLPFTYKHNVAKISISLRFTQKGEEKSVTY